MADLAIDSRDSMTEEAARRALMAACQRAGLRADGAELIRLGSNAVFRLDADTVARVAPTADARANATMQIAVSRWLESVGYPATRATTVDQPVEANGRVVTFWESVAPKTVYAPIDQVADLIRRLHDLPPPRAAADLPPLRPFGAPADALPPPRAAADLPPLRPFGAPADALPRFSGLDDADATYLSDRYAWARETFATMTFPLGLGAVHGDANVGNVLVDTHGDAVLIDLDSFSIGPREWDLIQTALFADRLGWHTAEEYRTFVEIYGYDITEWDGYEALADMREVSMTAWISKKAAGDKRAAAEAQKRIAAMRSGGSRRDWGAY